MGSNKTIKLQEEKRVFDEYFQVDRVVVDEFENGIYKSSIKRYKLTRKDAVAVLLYNEDTKKVILAKQFRYPINHKVSENILEAVAGKIEEGQTPKQAAVREVFEEVGYVIDENKLDNPFEMFASPGYSTETIYIFLAVVKNSDKDPNAGGGLKDEHEDIDTIEMSPEEFISKIDNNEIKDSKTIIASRLIKL